MSAIHWVNRCRGGREPRAGALMRMLGFLEMGSGWRFRTKHVHGVAKVLALCVTMGSSHHRRQSVCVSSRHQLAGTTPGRGGGESLYPHLGRQYVGSSVAGSTKRTYESGRRSWRKFRRLMRCPESSESSDSDSHKTWALVEFSSWCCTSEGILANTIPGKFAAVQYFRRLHVGGELPVTAPVV